jgi:hypothetical protein
MLVSPLFPNVPEFGSPLANLEGAEGGKLDRYESSPRLPSKNGKLASSVGSVDCGRNSGVSLPLLFSSPLRWKRRAQRRTEKSRLTEREILQAVGTAAAGTFLDRQEQTDKQPRPLVVRVGFEPSHLYELAQVTNSTNRQKRENRYFRQSEVHGGYTDPARRVKRYIRSRV